MRLKALTGPFFTTITLLLLFPGTTPADSDSPLADKLFTNGAIYTLDDTHMHFLDTIPLVSAARLSPDMSAEEVIAAMPRGRRHSQVG